MKRYFDAYADFALAGLCAFLLGMGLAAGWPYNLLMVLSPGLVLILSMIWFKEDIPHAI